MLRLRHLASELLILKRSKVSRVRAVGTGPSGLAWTADQVVEAMPTLHGQKVGRLATAIVAICLAVVTTGATSQHSVAQPMPTNDAISTVALLHQS